jgi:hypothetical protein
MFDCGVWLRGASGPGAVSAVAASTRQAPAHFEHDIVLK